MDAIRSFLALPYLAPPIAIGALIATVFVFVVVPLFSGTGQGILLAAVVATLVMHSIRRIPADPPHYGVLKVLGHRMPVVLGEGMVFLPLYPFLYDVVLVDGRKKNQDIKSIRVRTPSDMADMEIDISGTFSPDEGNLIPYLNSGGEEGVRNILVDVISEAIRAMVANPDEEPFTWETAVRMRPEFLVAIVEKVLGMSADVGTTEEVLHELQIGNGNLRLATLGIVLHRVNITRIQPADKALRDAAAKRPVEIQERKAEKTEAGHIANLISVMRRELPHGSDVSDAQLLELAELITRKSTKKVAGLASETVTALVEGFKSLRRP